MYSYIDTCTEIYRKLSIAKVIVNVDRSRRNFFSISLVLIRSPEKETLASLVDSLVWYKPSNEDLNKYGDGGVAIIDQWIAAHAKYFTG